MAPSTDPSPPSGWWSLPARIIGLIVGLAGLGKAVVEIAGWPSWVLISIAPVGLVAIVLITPLSFWRKAGAIGLGLGALGAGGAMYLVFHAASQNAPSHFSAGASTPKDSGKAHAPRPSSFSVPLSNGVREITTTNGDLVALTGTTSIAGLDGDTYIPMGPVLSTPTPLAHALECDGRLIVTFGGGLIAAVDRDRMRLGQPLRYGYPTANGPRADPMACGPDGTLYVAMTLEGRVVKFKTDPLRKATEIKNVGQEVSDLAFTNDVLYALDDTQAAIVTIKDDVPSRWILTMLRPDQIVPLGNGSVLVTHRDSRCLGLATQGVHEEQGADWSLKGPVVFAETGKGIGVILDNTGTAYRFDAGSGDLISEPFKVPGADALRTGTVLPSGDVILAGSSDSHLLIIPPGAWRPIRRQPQAARGCLGAR